MNALLPTRIAGLALRNRIAVAPMSRTQGSPEGLAPPEAAPYYARFARHGAGLVFTEALYIDDDASRAYFSQPGLADEAQAAAWQPVTEAVHAAGGRIFAQLQHAGRLAEPGLNRRVLGLVASTAAGPTWQTGRAHAPALAASADDLASIVERFAAAALRAQQAGFDGVEVHGARGYLVNESLSDVNRRTDAWGERCALATAIVRCIRERGCRLALSFNYSIYKMDEPRYQPPGGRAEVGALFAALRAAGVDLLHLSSRRSLRPESWGLTLAETAAQDAPGECLVNGGLATLADAEQALQLPGVSGVSLARPFLSNPDWIERCLQGAPRMPYVPGMERRPLLDGA